jgi:hypothetical protein
MGEERRKKKNSHRNGALDNWFWCSTSKNKQKKITGNKEV